MPYLRAREQLSSSSHHPFEHWMRDVHGPDATHQRAPHDPRLVLEVTHSLLDPSVRLVVVRRRVRCGHSRGARAASFLENVLDEGPLRRLTIGL